jgi:hypothetical protein
MNHFKFKAIHNIPPFNFKNEPFLELLYHDTTHSIKLQEVCLVPMQTEKGSPLFLLTMESLWFAQGFLIF